MVVITLKMKLRIDQIVRMHAAVQCRILYFISLLSTSGEIASKKSPNFKCFLLKAYSFNFLFHKYEEAK